MAEDTAVTPQKETKQGHSPALAQQHPARSAVGCAVGTEASCPVKHAPGLVTSSRPGTLQPLTGHPPGPYRSHRPVLPGSTAVPVKCISPGTCRAPELLLPQTCLAHGCVLSSFPVAQGMPRAPRGTGQPVPAVRGSPRQDELHPKGSTVGQHRAAKSSFVLSRRSGASGRLAWVIGSGEEAFLKVN